MSHSQQIPLPAAKRYAEIAARLRVPLGFVMILLYARFSKPVPWPAAAGAGLAFLGMALRALATGYLNKNRELSTSGPYSHTRNPLYLGTALVSAGFALAGGQLWIAGLFALFFLLVYLPVVGEEEAHLAQLFPDFRDYAARVPRFWPALRPRWKSPARFRWALYRQNQEYNAFLGYLLGLGILMWKLMTP